MKKQLFLSIPMLMLLLLTACNPDQATNNTAVSEKPESLITEKDNPTPITGKVNQPIIIDIQKEYGDINSKINSYKKIEKDLSGESTEGGNLLYYSDGEVVKKIVKTLYGETGKSVVEYYYKDNALFFVDEQNTKYNRPIYWDEKRAKELGDNEIFDPSKSTIIENRYYFNNNRLIQWLDSDKNPVEASTNDFIIKEGEIIQTAKKLQMQAFSESIQKSSENSNEAATNPTPKTTLKKTKEDGRYAYYNGLITLSGEYFMRAPGEMGGGTLCFHANKDTGYLVPREGVDARSPWFCFFDQDETKKTFEMDDTKIFKDGTESTVRCVEGKATIQVSDYMVDKMESEVSDMAKLEKIITKEPYAMECPGWE